MIVLFMISILPVHILSWIYMSPLLKHIVRETCNNHDLMPCIYCRLSKNWVAAIHDVLSLSD
jgi:hypothetical protein